MAATVVLVVFLALLFGGLALALGYGYLSIEREREGASEHASRPAVRAAKSVAAVPDLLAPSHAVPSPVAFVFDEAFVSRLEHHVRMEQALVAQFVHHPSINNLYRRSGAPLHVH
ncbi:MAG: hypothetical protein AB1806_07090 [Acidobacteriota bacterium]